MWFSKNSGSFACELVARALGQANVHKFASGFLFLSFLLFTVVVLTRPEKSLHILVNNPNTILHKKVNPK
jgi:hypothetical protein